MIEQENIVEETEPNLELRDVYMLNLQQEIDSFRSQLLNIQYQLDIRVTALSAYQVSLSETSLTNGELKEEEDLEEDSKLNSTEDA
jgi:chromosome condensin MukBEF ATPase and DNA-binding subunit MukB